MSRRRPKYQRKFIETLTKYNLDNDAILVIDQKFNHICRDIRFVSKSKNPLDKRLEISAYFLALIQALEKNGKSYDQIRSIGLEIAHNMVKANNLLQQRFKRLPARIISWRFIQYLLKRFNEKINSHDQTEGFKARVITDKNETYGLGYGVDILECGICKLYHKHNANKYVSILCEIDKITSELAGLELIRKGTIAGGAEKCDFRFKINKN